MNKCIFCNKQFEPGKFHVNQKFCSGECRRKRYYQNHKEWIKEMARKWAKRNKERRNELAKKSYEKNKDKILEYEKTNERKKKSDIRRKARYHIKIPKGQLCQICNEELAIEKHHENYSKPLEVMFVCRECHNKLRLKGGKRWQNTHKNVQKHYMWQTQELRILQIH